MRSSIRSPKTAAVLILAASLLAPVQARVHAAGGTLLRYHWVVGQTFSESETDTTTTIIKVKPAALGINSTSMEIDRYTTTTTVTKVFPDGSGLLSRTYSKVSITKDGKTTQYPLAGFALHLRVGTTGTLISKQTIGSASNLSQLPSNITDPTPTPYPQAPVSVGSTWTQTQTQAGLGKLVAQLQVVALGTMGGRPTLTIRLAANSPVRFTSSGLLFAGVVKISGTGTVFVDTGATASALSVPLSFNGKISGTVQGLKINGTMDITGIESITPLS